MPYLMRRSTCEIEDFFFEIEYDPLYHIHDIIYHMPMGLN